MTFGAEATSAATLALVHIAVRIRRHWVSARGTAAVQLFISLLQQTTPTTRTTSQYLSKSNISKMVQDRAIVT